MDSTLKVTVEKIDSLKLMENNPVRHGERNRKEVESSIKEFGIRLPIVAHESDRVVYEGNLRLEIMREMGFEEITVAWIPEEVPIDKARAFAVAVNRTSEFAEWNIDALKEITGLYDEMSLGFTQDELDSILGESTVYDLEDLDFTDFSSSSAPTSSDELTILIYITENDLDENFKTDLQEFCSNHGLEYQVRMK